MPRKGIEGGSGRITAYADHPWMEEMQKDCREQSFPCRLSKVRFGHSLWGQNKNFLRFIQKLKVFYLLICIRFLGENLMCLFDPKYIFVTLPGIVCLHRIAGPGEITLAEEKHHKTEYEISD